ncbi:MAG: hypothetical protein ACTSUE_13280, partial [Promethearchaeota archaeon]
MNETIKKSKRLKSTTPESKTKTSSKAALKKENNARELMEFFFTTLLDPSIIQDLVYVWTKIIATRDKNCTTIQDMFSIIFEYWVLKELNIVIENKEIRLFGDSYFAIPFSYVNDNVLLCKLLYRIIEKSGAIFGAHPNDPSNTGRLKLATCKFNWMCDKSAMTISIVRCLLERLISFESSPESAEFIYNAVQQSCNDTRTQYENTDTLDLVKQNLLDQIELEAKNIRDKWRKTTNTVLS